MSSKDASLLADQIIFVALKQLGCLLEVNTIVEFGAKELVKTVSVLINLINGNEELSGELPKSVAAKHRFCAKIGQSIRGLGYRGDCGYNQILYPEVKSTRSLVSFLLEKAPKNENKEAVTLSPIDSFFSKVGSCLKSERQKLRVNNTPIGRIPNSYSFSSVNFAFAGKKATNPVNVCKNSASLLASLSERNSIELCKSSGQQSWESIIGDTTEAENMMKDAFKHAFREVDSGIMSNDDDFEDPFDALERRLATNSASTRESRKMYKSAMVREAMFGLDNDDIVEDVQTVSSMPMLVMNEKSKEGSIDDESGTSQENGKPKEEAVPLTKEQKEKLESQKHAEELENLRNEVGKVEVTIQETEKQNSECQLSLEEVMSNAVVLRTQLTQEQHKLQVGTSAWEMLPDYEDNLAHLTSLCEASNNRLQQLKLAWSDVERTLLDEQNRIVGDIDKHKDMAGNIHGFMQETKDLNAEIRGLETQIELGEKKLRADLSGDVQRHSAYTQDIKMFVLQVRKQKAEVDRVIADIHDVEHELNRITDRLGRTEVLTEEGVNVVKKAHPKDSLVMSVIDKLSELRGLFASLVSLVHDIGEADRERRDLSRRCENLALRVHSQAVARLGHDLLEVQNENTALKEKINANV
eukprot:TRINITY_DN9240_c0_g1_i1.p1 TRINITY_DN9240_c0_g1~~TRINITY_DN9240_c0_g1_i1.p1  ORF type:complete len:639 (+),score=232.62 TRINITY_DN9240_c0_g1_i1:58-1974(+)